MNDVVSDIKSRLDIVDVVSQYVQLKQAGRNYKGLCPFHGEKTASFVVSVEKQICHCFGCHKGGDIFSFIEEIEGVGFAEAMEILADRAGIKLEKEKKNFNAKAKNEQDDFFKAHELACGFWQKNLYETNDGKKVLEYLYKRGVKDETIRDFRLGFASDKYDELFPYLLKKGVTQKILIQSGFVSAKNLADEKIYDKYRARLMFPIFNYFGKICGFGGRALKQDQMPKYLNSPENIIYNKSRVLYGLYQAKQAIKEKNQAILVEGYFDMILPYQEGVQNVIATSGTALTSDQVRMIKRLTSGVVTCFDADMAGFEATKRAYELILSQGISMKTVKNFGKKDPADLVAENGGEKFSSVVAESVDFLTFYIDKLLAENNPDSIDGRRAIMESILPYYKIISPSERDFYVRKLSQGLNVAEKFLYDEIDNFQLSKHHPANMSSRSDQLIEIKMSWNEILLAVLLEFPQFFGKVGEVLDESYFEGDTKAIYKVLLDQYNLLRAREEWDFNKDLAEDLKKKAEILLLYAEEKYANFSEEILRDELEKLIDRIRQERRMKRLKELQKEIGEAEKTEEKEKLMNLMKEHQELLSQK